MKKTASFEITDFTIFKIKMLNWANRFNIFCLLDNQQYNFETPAFECLLAAGCKRNTIPPEGTVFKCLKELKKDKDDWLFGHLCYDVKNETEQLASANFDGIGFPDAHFFVPEIVLELKEEELTILCGENPDSIFEAINSISLPGPRDVQHSSSIIKNRISKKEYIDTVKKIQSHILIGDCYEINFCQEFYADDTSIHPVELYKKLAEVSPNPFAALYKLHDKFCICASPERYLKKTGNKVISQPIKGTAKRKTNDFIADEQIKKDLLGNPKEKSENVMVVDLVRNDLSKICKEATVRVDELFGIYSFPQVHQMVSTVSGEVEEGLNWVDMIKATFPMGSMTGAPKKRVMELIECYEQTRRGLFSGTIGYVKPDGDFDFNVVIRSILYNEESRYLSFQTGSAITFYSDPEKEYEECLLKAAAIKKVLE